MLRKRARARLLYNARFRRAGITPMQAIRHPELRSRYSGRPPLPSIERRWPVDPSDGDNAGIVVRPSDSTPVVTTAMRPPRWHRHVHPPPRGRRKDGRRSR